MGWPDLVAIAGVLLAFGAGACAMLALPQRARARRRTRAEVAAGPGVPQPGCEGASGRVIDYLVHLSERIALRKATAGPWAGAFARLGRFDDVVARSGFAGRVSREAFGEAMARLAFLAGAIGCVVGLVMSNELGALGAVLGAAWGFSAPRRSLAASCRARLASLERDLPELLEVVALGVRSGLSFDRSFELYVEHFDSGLSRECACAMRSWSLGLESREEALKALADSYGSAFFTRVVSSIVRSLRFGTALGASLEQAAAEARSVHRAHVEERVAKAPVKMMIPTGTLILPAMLLLVLGPVLLELMGGY